jgi:YbgC/YbaW family acyl-CoA thioester hydrolase
MSEESWLELRFRDVDAFGHVYHAEYLTFLDTLRARWFASVGVDDPEQYVVARVEIDYLSSLVLADERVRATFEVERVGTSSITMREVVLARDGREVARTRVVVVLRDPATGASRPVRDHERALLRMPKSSESLD